MNAHPFDTTTALSPAMPRGPWILSLRPATLGMVATLAVALIAAAVLLQPRPAMAEAETASAIVDAVRGV